MMKNAQKVNKHVMDAFISSYVWYSDDQMHAELCALMVFLSIIRWMH